MLRIKSNILQSAHLFPKLKKGLSTTIALKFNHTKVGVNYHPKQISMPSKTGFSYNKGNPKQPDMLLVPYHQLIRNTDNQVF